MTVRIYTTDYEDNTVAVSARSAGHETTTQTILNGGTKVESTGVSARSFDIDIQFNGPRRASRRAAVLEELGTAPAVTPLPVSGLAPAGYDGYYVVSRARREVGTASDAHTNESLEVGVERAGTRETHLLAAETTVTQPDPGHTFGNDTDAIVGIPASARRVRIVDATSEPSVRERPTPVATVEAEHGAVDLFDASGEPIDDPVYLYDLPYGLQGDVGVTVWDTYGSDTIRDTGGDVVWRRVFDTAHEFGGEVVLENGLLRLTVDETATLQAETWDAGADTWTVVDLPSYADGDLATDWQPADVDLTHIGPARVAAQVGFEAVAGTNAGDVYAVDVELERGRSDAEVWIPESVTDPIPDDLEALLEPIASASVVDSGVEQGLVAREEVRL